jgi:hypothetical protein
MELPRNATRTGDDDDVVVESPSVRGCCCERTASTVDGRGSSVDVADVGVTVVVIIIQDVIAAQPINEPNVVMSTIMNLKYESITMYTQRERERGLILVVQTGKTFPLRMQAFVTRK